MDKRKYQAKRLICEYENLDSWEELRFSEMAYRCNDGSIIIEYAGNGLSIYGVKISFRKCISRKGVFSISYSDFKIWKSIRHEDKERLFVDWEEQWNNQLGSDHEQY
jgi:hypothetical protein